MKASNLKLGFHPLVTIFLLEVLLEVEQPDLQANMKFSTVAIIAGDSGLAEQVCSHLRKPGIYIPLIEAPITGPVPPQLFENACIRVSNAIRALNPPKVLLLKVMPAVAEKLRILLAGIECESMDEFDRNKLPKYASLNRSPIGYQNLLLSGSDGYAAEIFSVEGDFDMSHVIAANLAVAHDGRVLRLAAVPESELDWLTDEFRVWSNGDSHDERNAAMVSSLHYLAARLPKPLLDTKSDRPISFITSGAPYGLLPFSRPTTHFFPFPFLGLNVCAGMLKCLSRARCPVVVIFDPNTVGKSEFQFLRETFAAAGYQLRVAFDSTATVTNARYLTQYLPSDFIFFSTHCGELSGERITERFPASDGIVHEICYDGILSISPTPEFVMRPSPDGLIEVMYLYVPISMDGIKWNDQAGKEKINAGQLLKDFIDHAQANKETSNGRQFLNKVESKQIKGFEGLQMADGNYLPVHEDIGACHYPVVFNNACCSWRTLAKNFGCSGAASYIGTATDVLNAVATNVASSFVKAVTTGKCVGLSLFRAQKEFTNQFGYTPYLMHGYYYTKLNNPNPLMSRERVGERLVSAIEAAARLPESQRKGFMITFLKQELDGFTGSLSQSMSKHPNKI